MTARTTFFALAACVALAVPPNMGAQTQTVKLTTQKTAGEELTLVVNAAARVAIDWGDGQSVTATTDTTRGTLRGQTLTITGPAEWSTLGCEGQGITSVDLAAPYLNALYLAHNELAEADVSACTALTDLDLSDNQLTTLSLNKNTNLLSLNLSHNKLSALNIYYQAALQELNIAHNNFSSFTFYRNNTALESVNCVGNQIAKLSLIYLSGLHSLFCWSNDMQTLTLGSRDSLVEAVWCDSNRIAKLDLSPCRYLKQLSATQNELTDITYPDAANKDDYTLLSLQNNRLTYLQLLPRQNIENYAVNYTYAPQAPVAVAAHLPVDSTLSLANYRYNVNGKYIGITLKAYTTTDNEALLSGTDYTTSSGTIRFKHSVSDSVYVVMQNSFFPALSLATTNFHIDSPVGISTVQGGSSLTVSAQNHTLVLTSGKPQAASVYSADGALVWHGRVDGSRTLMLPRGIYVVNGKKVSL